MNPHAMEMLRYGRATRPTDAAGGFPQDSGRRRLLLPRLRSGYLKRGRTPAAGITLGPALTFGFIAGEQLASTPDAPPP